MNNRPGEDRCFFLRCYRNPEVITKNCTPKQHRTACPLKVADLTQTATLDVTEADTQNPLLIERGGS